MGAPLYRDSFSQGGAMGGGAMGGGSSPSNNVSFAGRYTPSNNASYANSVRSTTTTTVTSESGGSVGTVKQYGSSNITNFNVSDYVKNLTNSSGGMSYTYYTDDQKSQMSDPERSLVERYEAMQKVAEELNKKKQEVKEQTQGVANGVNYQPGETLPSVLSKNAKSLTEAINALTNAFTDQFALLNNYMMGGLIYKQQFLDIKTEESGFKIESMKFMKETQPVYDLDGNKLGDAVPRDLKVQKDAVVGIDHTDKINFDIDDLNDGDFVDLSGIVGYEDGSDIMRKYIELLGGTV